MKYSFSILSLCICTILLVSFKTVTIPPVRSYNLFYVDNSYSSTYENFGQEMFGMLDAKMDSIRDAKFSQVGFFLSDGPKTAFAPNYNGAKTFVNQLSNANTNAPNSFYDRSYIIDNLLAVDLSTVKEMNINLFLTEAGMLNDYLSGSNAGIILNSLPRQIQYLLSLSEESITVVIYYPSGSKKVTLSQLESFVNFSNCHDDFASKIKYKIQPI